MHSLKDDGDHPTSTTAKAGACALVYQHDDIQFTRMIINDAENVEQIPQLSLQYANATEHKPCQPTHTRPPA